MAKDVAVIRIEDIEATFDGETWHSEDQDLTDILNGNFRPRDEDYSPSVPNFYLQVAQRAADAFDGVVIDYPPSDYVEGRVY